MEGRQGLRIAVWGMCLALAAALLPTPAARGEGGDAKPGDAKQGDAKTPEPKKECRPVVDETQVYFGKAQGCRAPAVVDADRVFRSIPEYKRILEQKLTAKDAEYSILMVKATRRFRAAVAAAATDANRDLVAKVGSVTWEGHEIPDLTDATLKKVEEKAGG